MPRVLSPRRIHEQVTETAREGALNGIVRHRGRVGVGRTGDHLQGEPPAPDLQLLHGGGAEGIPRCEEHRSPLGTETSREFGQGRRFSRAIHPHHEPDDGARGRERGPRRIPAQEGGNPGTRCGEGLGARGQRVEFKILAHHPDQLRGEARTEVGGDEGALHFRSLPAGRHESGSDGRTRLRETMREAIEKAHGTRGGSGRQGTHPLQKKIEGLP